MTDRDDAMARRVREAGFHLEGRGGGSAGISKFKSELHPHDRVGKFARTFHVKLKKHSEKNDGSGKSTVHEVHVNGQHVGFVQHLAYSGNTKQTKGAAQHSYRYLHGTGEDRAKTAHVIGGEELPIGGKRTTADVAAVVAKHVEAKHPELGVKSGEELQAEIAAKKGEPTKLAPTNLGAKVTPQVPAPAAKPHENWYAKSGGFVNAQHGAADTPKITGVTTPGAGADKHTGMPSVSADYSKMTDDQLAMHANVAKTIHATHSDPKVKAEMITTGMKIQAEQTKRVDASTKADQYKPGEEGYKAAEKPLGAQAIPGAGAVVNGVAGRHVKLNGVQVHIPHHAAFERMQGGDKFTSPAGSTVVLKNGVMYSAPRGNVKDASHAQHFPTAPSAPSLHGGPGADPFHALAPEHKEFVAKSLTGSSKDPIPAGTSIDDAIQAVGMTGTGPSRAKALAALKAAKKQKSNAAPSTKKLTLGANEFKDGKINRRTTSVELTPAEHSYLGDAAHHYDERGAGDHEFTGELEKDYHLSELIDAVGQSKPLPGHEGTHKSLLAKLHAADASARPVTTADEPKAYSEEQRQKDIQARNVARRATAAPKSEPSASVAITRTKLPNGTYAFHDQSGKQLRTSKHAYTHMSTYENGATTFHKTPESASKPTAAKWYGVPRTSLIPISEKGGASPAPATPVASKPSPGPFDAHVHSIVGDGPKPNLLQMSHEERKQYAEALAAHPAQTGYAPERIKAELKRVNSYLSRGTGTLPPAPPAKPKPAPGTFDEVRNFPVGTRWHAFQGDRGHGVTITGHDSQGRAKTVDAAGNTKVHHPSTMGYAAGEAKPVTPQIPTSHPLTVALHGELAKAQTEHVSSVDPIKPGSIVAHGGEYKTVTKNEGGKVTLHTGETVARGDVKLPTGDLNPPALKGYQGIKNPTPVHDKPGQPALRPDLAAAGSPSRSSAGRLRNFASMSDAKLQDTHAAQVQHNQFAPAHHRDPQAHAALVEELQKRGLASKPAAASKAAADQAAYVSKLHDTMTHASFPVSPSKGETLRPELNSPGRSSAGRMRNFQAMSDAKLTTVLTQLTHHNHPTYGQDHEALAAAQAEAIKRTMYQHMQEAEFSAEDRKQLAKKKVAMPDGSFPIRNGSDLANAVHAVGRAKDKAAAKRHIVKRAKALKAESQLPEDWLQEADEDSITEAEMIEAAAEYMREAADSLAKASTPEPFSTSKTSNWIARLGGLPNYIQHVAHGLVRSGKTESEAIQMAIGIVRRWARGGGNVDSGTKAAAAKAVGEWEALKAKQKAVRASHAAS